MNPNTFPTITKTGIIWRNPEPNKNQASLLVESSMLAIGKMTWTDGSLFHYDGDPAAGRVFKIGYALNYPFLNFRKFVKSGISFCTNPITCKHFGETLYVRNNNT